MSKVEKSDLTAGGDAPPIEEKKTDCADNTVIIVAVKSTDTMLEDAVASTTEVAKEVLNVQAENEPVRLEVANDANVPGGEEVTNPDAPTAETTNVITEIIYAPAENVDVTDAAEAQKSAEESNSSALQSEEMLKSANKEKV